MSFKCQRCKQLLRIDDSLLNIDQASADMLLAPLIAEEQHELETQKLLKSTSKKTSTLSPLHSRRIIGIKPSGLSLKQQHQQQDQPFHRKSIQSSGNTDDRALIQFPTPSESFVVLSRQAAYPSPSSASTSSSSSSSAVNRPQHLQNTPQFNANKQTSTDPDARLTNTSKSVKTDTGTSPAVDTPTTGTTLTAATAEGTKNNSTLFHRLKVTDRIFEFMSSRSNVDHPLCQECTDLLLELLEKQMADASKERDCYIEFLKRVKGSRITAEEEEELQKQVEELKLAEDEASAELQKLQEEEQSLDEQLAVLNEQMAALDRREEEFWEQANAYQLHLQTFQNERDSMNTKYDHDVRQYERLQKTVVYNDAFCISHDGPFGTINGFRLGRTSTQIVDWSEINAAWGQTLLLLYTVANKLKFQFKTYRLVPMGSFSRVEKIDGDSVVSYELYGSGDFGINKMFFLNRRFDHAMVAVLNCLRQLTDYAEERDKTLRLPYRINKDKIGDLSIRIQFNQDELWTKALKYMLTNMKWILVFASRASVLEDATVSKTFSDNVSSSS